MPIGPAISIPWGLVLYTFIGTVVLMIISEIWWRVMSHLPEDDMTWSEESRFIIESDLDADD